MIIIIILLLIIALPAIANLLGLSFLVYFFGKYKFIILATGLGIIGIRIYKNLKRADDVNTWQSLRSNVETDLTNSIIFQLQQDPDKKGTAICQSFKPQFNDLVYRHYGISSQSKIDELAERLNITPIGIEQRILSQNLREISKNI